MEPIDVNRRTVMFFAVSSAIAVIGPRSAWTKELAVATVTSSELAAMLEKKDLFFVNVHTPYEGEIRNTDAFIVFDKISANLDKLPQNKTAKIVLYCRSGHMSEIATRELTKLGYTNVSHLSGGMIDWKKNGYEILEK